MLPLALDVPFAPAHGAGPALHIPDGFLSLPVALACWAIVVIVARIATARIGGDLGGPRIPLMGVMAAFIFAAQMINFPVAGGTSGHLLGGTLAALTLGPWPAMLVMTAVIALQGLLFQDGGLLSMGANIVNMGLLTVVVGAGLARAAAGRGRLARLGVAGIAAWLSVVAAALVTSLELWLSGTSALRIVVPAMLGVHVVIGLGEAAITVAALGFIARVRPDVLADGAPDRGGRRWAVAGVLATLGVVLLAPFASLDPDGLERVAADLGFLGASRAAPFGVLPDYTVPGLAGHGSTIVAGLIGTAALFALVGGGAALIARRRARGADAAR